MATDDKRYNPGSRANDAGPPVISGPPTPKLPPVGNDGVVSLQSLPGQSRIEQNDTGDNVLRGRLRWNAQKQTAPALQGTPEFDQWVLSLKTDPTDFEYNDALGLAQRIAQQNVRERQQEMQQNLKPPKSILASLKSGVQAGAKQGLEQGGYKTVGLTTDDERAMDRDQKRQANPYLGGNPPNFVSYDGIKTDADKESLGGGTPKPGSQSSDIADSSAGADYADVTDDQYIQAGGAVWVGDQMVQGPAGQKMVQGQYRNAADMMNDIYRWNSVQLAAFQKRYGLEVTGVQDDKTVQLWQWAVNTARYNTAMGQHRTVDSLLVGATNNGRGRGGGGGGGGGGGVPADAAKRLLNSAMKEYAGREATAEELKSFLPAIRGAAGGADFDASQFAIDWVRGGDNGARQTEVGNFQAGTNYYDVVQQLIGGR